jgi:hypothetical protein
MGVTRPARACIGGAHRFYFTARGSHAFGGNMKISRLLGSALAAPMLVLAVIVPAAQAAPATAMGPEIPAAQPANGFVGKLAVAPLHATEGSTVTVTGEGLPANQALDLVWRTVKGSWKAASGEYHGRDYSPVGYRIASIKTDAAGKFSTSFVAPEDFGFQHDIVVQQGERLLSQAGFTLDMTMTVTPENGPPGTPITFDIKGIGWRELENSWMLVYDNNFTGWISSVSTHGSAHFTIPASGPAGTHVLQLIHGEFTFPYMNPQQNPVPDRPRFKTNFTVTRGEAVLPAAAEAQLPKSVRGLPKRGALIATPAFAGVGQPLTVSGEGFAPGKSYQLQWTTVTGNRVVAGGWEERAHPIAEAKADNAGKLAFHFNVPDDLGGTHGIFVEDGGKKTQGAFWLEPSALPLSAQEVPAGTTITVHLKGVGWTETANIYHVVYDDNYVGYACGFNSQGDLTVYMPASGAPGWHFIDLYPGIYKGQETRPNNFRIPQLTYAEDHPGEDLPAFHFAVHVTGDEAEHAQK